MSMPDRHTRISEVTSSSFPLPPMNVQAVSPYLVGAVDVRWDNPASLPVNSKFTVIGVNVYRSFGSQYGPFERLNTFPIQTTFYRDRTELIHEIEEDVSGRWLYQGNQPTTNTGAGRTPLYVFRTAHQPIVKSGSQGILADNSKDVRVTIDGHEAVVTDVNGASGEVTVMGLPYFDVLTQKTVDPVLPVSGSRALCSYWWTHRMLQTDLATRIFYRVTTVAVLDGVLMETPLDSELVVSRSPAEVERLDYIWEEAIRRNRWILQQGGERAKLFIRKENGILCSCVDLNGHKTAKDDCVVCFGTRYRGGYEGPYEVLMAPDDSERRKSRSEMGSHVQHTREEWTGPSPLLSQRDFIVRQNNERYVIGGVTTPTVRGAILQQSFQMSLLDEKDIRYQVPVVGTDELAFPQTRVPAPQGGDSVTDEAVFPQITDKPGVTMQERGRTAVWENINY